MVRMRSLPQAAVWLACALLLQAPLKTSGADYVEGKAHKTVQDLTRGTFQRAIEDDPANPMWLLKFYAPWCGHCKRLLPVFNEAAPLLEGKMALGKIDCTVQKGLCSEFNVKGYPTLKFARDGRVFDYPGGRTVDDILKFARKMSAPAVKECETVEDALKLTADDEQGIVFVGYHPKAKGETKVNLFQSTSLTQVLSQVARMQQAYTTFCLLSSEVTDLSAFGLDSAPDGFVAKLEVNVPPTVKQGGAELDTPTLLNFVKETNVPLVTALGPRNFHKVGNLGRKLVIGATTGSNEDQVEPVKKELTEYALNGPKRIVDQYYFGWIDGKQWQKFLEQFNIGPDNLPQVFCLDVPNKDYWQNETYTTVKDLLTAIEEGKVEMRNSAGRGKGYRRVLQDTKRAFLSFLPWSAVAVVAVGCALIIIIYPTQEELRAPYVKKLEAKTTSAPAESKQDDAAEDDEPKKEK